MQPCLSTKLRAHSDSVIEEKLDKIGYDRAMKIGSRIFLRKNSPLSALMVKKPSDVGQHLTANSPSLMCSSLSLREGRGLG